MIRKKLEVGDVIYSKTMGTGKITQIGYAAGGTESVIVNFGSEKVPRPKKFSMEYVLKYYELSDQAMNEGPSSESDGTKHTEAAAPAQKGKTASAAQKGKTAPAAQKGKTAPAAQNGKTAPAAQKGKTAPAAPKKKEIERIVREFRIEFNLTPMGCGILREFFSFWVKCISPENRNYGVKHNLFVRCEEPEQGRRFVEKVMDASVRLGILEETGPCLKEAEFLGRAIYEIPESRMIGVYWCRMQGVGAKANEKLSISELDSKRKAAEDNKADQWNEVTKAADAFPNCAIVAAGSTDFYEFFQKVPDLKYFQFPKQIFVPPLTQKKVETEIMKDLHEKELKETPYFLSELKKYIASVYPMAALRDQAFVDDTINRIMLEYFKGPMDGKLRKACVPFYTPPKSFEEIMVKIDKLVGLEKVKEKFHDLYLESQDEARTEKMRLNFVFEGNPGTGKTSVARLAADFLRAAGLIRNSKNFLEVSRGDFADEYTHSAEKRMQAKIREAKGGVLFIDEAYFLADDTRQNYKEALDVLLAAMEDPQKDFAVILAGYTGKMEHMLSRNPGMRSRLWGIFEFEDFTVDQLIRIFKDKARSEGRRVAPKAEDLLRKRIELEKTTKDFGNARAMDNLYRSLMSQCLKKNPKAKTITVKAIQASMPNILEKNLDDLIGLEKIKDALTAFEKVVSYRKYLGEEGVSTPAPRMHMMFTGNPGTGKTTVAERIADSLFRIGVLKSNKLIIAERKDLVSPDKGGTAIKTEALIQEALDGVLFIDEAYTLYKENDPGDYGVEAIETLITAMEEYRDRLIIIFAGYVNEMNRFLQANPGIESRIGHTFRFEDYNANELTEMFCRKLHNGGFELDPKAVPLVRKVMRYFAGAEHFGNGRFVESFIDCMIGHRADREPYGKDILPEDIPGVKDMLRALSMERLTEDEKTKEMWMRTACHEAGHALVGRYLDPYRRVVYITIRGDVNCEGYTAMEPIPVLRTEKYMKALMAAAFGGRNAERILFGDSSDGCGRDYYTAKQIASNMVNIFAMGDLGVTREMDLLREADARATEILTDHREELINVTNALLKCGALDTKDFEYILQHGELPEEKPEKRPGDQPEDRPKGKTGGKDTALRGE